MSVSLLIAFATATSETGLVMFGTRPMLEFSSSIVMPADLMASETATKSFGWHFTVKPPSSLMTSSAPASSATSITLSSVTPSAAGIMIWPSLSKRRDALPGFASSTPFFLKTFETSAAARFLLSVRTRTTIATLPLIASYWASTISADSSSPVPFLIARSMLSFGICAAFAFAISVRSVGLLSGSPPFAFTTMVISLPSFEKILPFFASAAPFARLIVAQWL